MSFVINRRSQSNAEYIHIYIYVCVCIMFVLWFLALPLYQSFSTHQSIVLGFAHHRSRHISNRIVNYSLCICSSYVRAAVNVCAWYAMYAGRSGGGGGGLGIACPIIDLQICWKPHAFCSTTILTKNMQHSYVSWVVYRRALVCARPLPDEWYLNGMKTCTVGYVRGTDIRFDMKNVSTCHILSQTTATATANEQFSSAAVTVAIWGIGRPNQFSTRRNGCGGDSASHTTKDGKYALSDSLWMLNKTPNYVLIINFNSWKQKLVGQAITTLYYVFFCYSGPVLVVLLELPDK